MKSKEFGEPCRVSGRVMGPRHNPAAYAARLALPEKCDMDRYWLITWTCYGSRLPGDAKGFVGNVIDENGDRVSHNIPGSPVDADLPRLERYAR